MSNRVDGFDYKKAEADLWDAGCRYSDEIWSMREEKSVRNMMHEYGLNEQKYYTKKTSSSSSSSSSSADGCYVATCVYGSYDCPQVWTLRRFRDNVLAKTSAGRAFVRTYYAISPGLVSLFGGNSVVRMLWKYPLDALVSRLHRQGVEDTAYEDLPRSFFR